MVCPPPSTLQFGHGTEPWRNLTRETFWPPKATFNSATARSRGETCRCGALAVGLQPSIRPRHGAVEKLPITLVVGSFTQSLQFGHGTEPWRNESRKRPERSWRRNLQFGHGTEPWRNSTAHAQFVRDQDLQFGHGTEPWRNSTRKRWRGRPRLSFNSATARSRGETSPTGARPSPRD